MLARLSITIDLTPDDDDHQPLFVRRCLNGPEIAAVWGIHDRTVRRWRTGERQGPIPPEAFVILGPRRYLVDVERVPANEIARLVPQARELLHQLRVVPVGSTRLVGHAFAEPVTA